MTRDDIGDWLLVALAAADIAVMLTLGVWW